MHILIGVGVEPWAPRAPPHANLRLVDGCSPRGRRVHVVTSSTTHKASWIMQQQRDVWHHVVMRAVFALPVGGVKCIIVLHTGGPVIAIVQEGTPSNAFSTVWTQPATS